MRPMAASLISVVVES
uniref:Uncharacterized protein n=1 Tax=Anguilla anguilla TaxID=7936 RepID=A0A0E9R058_ANGAN